MTTGLHSGVLQKRKPKPDQWTKAMRADFLRRLAATCNVTASCQAIGKTPAGLYRLRSRDPGFAREWEIALEQGYQHLEAELLRRALGERLAETAAAMEESAAAAEEERGADGPDREDQGGHPPAAAPADLDINLALRLMAQWRDRDPQGRRRAVQLKQPSAHDVLAALDRKLTAMEKRLGRGA